MEVVAASNSQASSFAVRAAWCIFFASGIIVSLIIYGVLQERIMTVAYDGSLFEYSIFLVFMNRVAAVVFALAMACARREELGNAAPLWKYAVISLANVAASTCQYEALKYVSFTVQMLGKSFKMMPVMLWGIVISSKSYGFQDWAVAAAVTGGVTEFLATGPIASTSTQGNSTTGLLLLLAFLALDGITSTMQEKLFKEHSTTKYNQMMYINGISALTGACTLLATGELQPAVAFSGAHAAFLRDAVCLSASAVVGQWFIYSQVKEFGALVFAATMNVRQIASILLSFAIYQHAISGLQALGLICTFAALLYKSCSGLLLPQASAGEKLQLLKPSGGSGGQQLDKERSGAENA